MTVEYYVYEIRELLPNDYKNVDNRYILRLLSLQRALFLKNEVNKGRPVNDQISQTLTDVDINVVNRSEVPGISSRFNILKSAIEIPTPILLAHRPGIESVRDSDILTDSFDFLTKDMAIHAGSGKFNQRDTYAFLYKNYMYIKLLAANPKQAILNNISIEGIFEDPIEVIKINAGEGDDYDFMQAEYPINDTVWSYIKANVLEYGFNVIRAEEEEDEHQD